MSFLWHGLTEQGAQVPVQVDAQGRVIAVDGTPGVSNWERTGTTLSPAVPGDSVSIGGTLPSAPNISLNADGSATFAGSGTFSGASTDDTRAYVYSGTDAVSPQFQVRLASGFPTTTQPAFNVERIGTGSVASISTDGSGTFTGNVTAANITFRSADPSLYVPNERSESYDGSDTYIGPELNLLEEIVRLEALVKHLYDVLRQNPPSGWDVWDGDTDLIKSRGRRPH